MRAKHPYLIGVFHIGVNSSDANCISSPFIHLLVEYIPIRLDMVSELDLEEALSVLYASFKGLNAI